MAVEISREGWIQLFTQMRSPTGFLQRFFTVKPGGQYNGKKVAVDIERFGEQVAIAVKKCTGSNLNDFDEFTTKEFEPPSYGEGFPVDVCELLDRMAGVDPYTAAYQGYAAQLAAKLAKGFKLVDDKIQRAIELQASQILQTGTLTLTNQTGDTVYEVDFKPKATHFPTVGTTWGNPAADALGDLESLADAIRADGKIDPNILIMGSSALSNFLNNTVVKERADIRRFELAQVRPEMRNSGATLYGTVFVGAYEFEIWTYKEIYEDPQTGNPTKYISPDNVVMLSDGTRLDKASARVPLPLGPDPRVAGLVPGRMQTTGRDGYDVTPNLYPSPAGTELMGDLYSRTLLIPVQIDGFGCLTTVP